MASTDLDEMRDQAYSLLDSGQLAEAKHLFQQLSELDAKDPETWMMLGAIHGEQNAFDEATRCLSESIRLEEDNPEAHVMMANIQHAQGDTESAVQSCEKAVQLNPDSLECWTMLSGLYGILGKLENVEEACKRVIGLDPKSANAYANLSNALTSQGKIEDALEALQKALAINPADQVLRAQLGHLWLHNGFPDLASQLFETVLRALPDDLQATLGMGSVYFEANKYEDAMQSYQKALNSQPNLPEAHLGLSNIYLANNLVDEALKHSNIVLQQDPNNLFAIANEVRSLNKKGDLDAACERLQPLLDSHRDNIAIAKTFAQICHHRNECGKAISWINEFISDGSQPRHITRQLHFLSGKLNNDVGDYDTSFAHFEQGNKLTTAVFNKEKYVVSVDKLIRAYSKDNLQKLPRAQHESNRPVFVIGMPSSGISQIAEILAVHPDIYNAGRMPDIGNISSGMSRLLKSDKAYPECIEDIGQSQVDESSKTYLDSLARINSTAGRVIDCALVNYLHLGLIEILFPNAIVIHCYKEPLNACLSCYTSDIGEESGFISKLDNISVYYRQYRRVMKHWKSALSIPVLEVDYEELTRDASKVSREMIEFCKLELDNTVLNNMASHAHEVESASHPVDPGNFSALDELRAELEND